MGAYQGGRMMRRHGIVDAWSRVLVAVYCCMVSCNGANERRKAGRERS